MTNPTTATGTEANAFERWLDQERRAVFRLCVGFLADVADAEDATQEVLMKLSRHHQDAAAVSPAYRATVARNVCRDAHRRRETRAAKETGAAREERSPLPDPQDQASRADVQRVLVASLQSLPPREREAFVLRELEGHDTATVARILDVGESTVRSLLTLARRHLRETLGPRLREDPHHG